MSETVLVSQHGGEAVRDMVRLSIKKVSGSLYSPMSGVLSGALSLCKTLSSMSWKDEVKLRNRNNSNFDWFDDRSPRGQLRSFT